MKQFSYVITDKEGIHARPAGLFVKQAGKFSSKITIAKGEKTGDAKRIFAVMGLGAKMGEWFKTENNNQSIIGKSTENNNMQVKKEGGDIDAITAATITSRAFLGAVRTAYAAYCESLKGGSHE